MTLSVIIVSYNTRTLLKQTIRYIKKSLRYSFNKGSEYEIIVVDNNSTDGTKQWLKDKKALKIILLNKNIGFGRANNRGLEVAKGRYVLFLNSDVHMKKKVDLMELVDFLGKDDKRAGLSIELMLESGVRDAACHRGFPTPINALWYFLGMESLTKQTPLARIFGGYHMTYADSGMPHEIDCPSAAFFLVKRQVVDELSGFDHDYFFYAEDIDLCYRIKQKGYSIWFYPEFRALHLKRQSGIGNKNKRVANASRTAFYKSMLVFYNKHYKHRYPAVVNFVVHLGVRIISFLRH